MKRIFVKQSDCVQLGHLYEHLFMYSVNRYLNEHGFYKYLDYYAYGTTYELTGAVVVEVEGYTPEVDKLLDGIVHLPIDYGTDNARVSIELARIQAEEPEELYVVDKHGLIDGLQDLARQPWRDWRSVDMVSAHDIKADNAPVYLTNQQAPAKRVLTIDLKLASDYIATNPRIAPLFVVLMRFLVTTLVDRVSWEFSAYPVNLAGMPNPLCMEAQLKVLQDQVDVDEAGVSGYVARELQDIATTDVLERFVAVFGHPDDQGTLPEVEQIVRETGVVVGAEGWKQTVTIDNVKQILNHTTTKVWLKSDEK